MSRANSNSLPVSVIIPTYNRRHTLPRAIDSVLQQSVSAAEVWVIDDGSTDGTAELINSQYPGINFSHQTNKGVSAARNAGIARSDCPWIAFLDSDDEWLPNKLENQFKFLEKNPTAKILHTDEIWIRDGTRVNPMDKHRKQGGDIFEQSLALCAMSPSTIVLHRDLFDEVGDFDESLPACEDYDLWLRLTSRYPVSFLDEQLVCRYGGHEDQLSKQHWGMDRFRVSALAKLLRASCLSMEQDRLTRNMLAEKCRVLMLGATKRNNKEVIFLCKNLLDEFQLDERQLNK